MQSKSGPFRPSIEDYKMKLEEAKAKVMDALRAVHLLDTIAV